MATLDAAGSTIGSSPDARSSRTTPKNPGFLHEVFAVVHELVGVVVRVGGEERRHGAQGFHPRDQRRIEHRAVRDLRTRVRPRQQLQRALHRREIHVDRHVAVGVAIHLDAGAMHALDPGVQRFLRLGDVAFVGRCHIRIRKAERHRPLGERSVDGVFRGGAELDPVVAETTLDAGADHGLERAAVDLIADAVPEIAAGADILHRRQVAALMMHAGQTVARELFRDVGNAFARARFHLRRRIACDACRLC